MQDKYGLGQMYKGLLVRCIKCGEEYKAYDCKTICPNCGHKSDCGEEEIVKEE